VAVVDANVDKNGTRKAAEAYLRFLYTPAAQQIIARNYYRPRDPAVAAQYKGQFPNVPLFTIANFGGWQRAQTVHFNDGGLFDQILEEAKK
jgi:sulfate transport system substrate-binding protein